MGKPCEACPWLSRDPEVKAIIEKHQARAAAETGAWFCCHVNLGTCYGAQLVHGHAVNQRE